MPPNRIIFAQIFVGRGLYLNQLLKLKNLSNRYLVMRHGHSLANLQGIIVSHPKNGIEDYGLSDQGVLQVNESGKANVELDRNSLIISSDFKRARQSADIMHRLLECDAPVVIDRRLRERYFGELELGPDNAYESVWREDQVDPDNILGGVESPNRVMQRVTALVFEYEEKLSGKTLLLVSHGDALQILQTAFSKQDASRHRQHAHLNTAEIRELVLAED
jgi:broad specificity phosphatase PhoE